MIKIATKKDDTIFKCNECGICRCCIVLEGLEAKADKDKTLPSDCPWGTKYPCEWKRQTKKTIKKKLPKWAPQHNKRKS